MKIKEGYNKIFERVFGKVPRETYCLLNVVLFMVVFFTAVDTYKYLSVGDIWGFFYNTAITVVCPLLIGGCLGYISGINSKEK